MNGSGAQKYVNETLVSGVGGSFDSDLAESAIDQSIVYPPRWNINDLSSTVHTVFENYTVIGNDDFYRTRITTPTMLYHVNNCKQYSGGLHRSGANCFSHRYTGGDLMEPNYLSGGYNPDGTWNSAFYSNTATLVAADTDYNIVAGTSIPGAFIEVDFETEYRFNAVMINSNVNDFAVCALIPNSVPPTYKLVLVGDNVARTRGSGRIAFPFRLNSDGSSKSIYSKKWRFICGRLTLPLETNWYCQELWYYQSVGDNKKLAQLSKIQSKGSNLDVNNLTVTTLVPKKISDVTSGIHSFVLVPTSYSPNPAPPAAQPTGVVVSYVINLASPVLHGAPFLAIEDGLYICSIQQTGTRAWNHGADEGAGLSNGATACSSGFLTAWAEGTLFHWLEVADVSGRIQCQILNSTMTIQYSQILGEIPSFRISCLLIR